MASGKMFATPSYDYEGDLEDLKRRQKIADAMLAQSMTPDGSPASGTSGGFTVAAPISPMQSIAKVLQGYVAGRQNAGLKEDRAKFNDAADETLKTDLNTYYDTSATDGRKAIIDALSSKHPTVRAIAQAQLSNQKGREVGEVNGILYDKGTLETLNLKPGGPTGQPGALPGVTDGQSGPGWKTVNIGGDLYQQTGTGLKKLDNAPKTNISVNASPVLMGQKEGMKEYWGSAAKQVSALGTAAAQGQQMIPKLQKLEALETSGVFSNLTSTPATVVNNLGQVLGVKVDTTKLQNSEQANAISKDLWVNLVKEAGGARGWTEPETKKLEAIIPNLNTSPEARKAMIEMMKQKVAVDQANYRHANKVFAESVKQDDPSVFSQSMEQVFLPSTGEAPAPGESPGVRKYNPTTGRIE